MVLGAFLTLAYYCAALIAKDILLPPLEPNEEASPTQIEQVVGSVTPVVTNSALKSS
jgi:hypothetical protein